MVEMHRATGAATSEKDHRRPVRLIAHPWDFTKGAGRLGSFDNGRRARTGFRHRRDLLTGKRDFGHASRLFRRRMIT